MRALTDGVRLAAAARPYPGETVNGDAWCLTEHAGLWRVALFDGLGHGSGAAEAAEAATRLLRERPALDPVAALHASHTALRGMRGAAGLVVRADPGANRLTVAGAGNVEGHLWVGGRRERLVSLRGIVGVTLPRLRGFDHDLGPDWLLVLHTDGVSARFDDATVFGDGTSPLDLQRVADSILAGWSRSSDDATVLSLRAGA